MFRQWDILEMFRQCDIFCVIIVMIYFSLLTSTEISVATRILQSNINIWLQGRDGQNNICFTKEEYILILLSVEMWICFYTRIISNCL